MSAEDGLGKREVVAIVRMSVKKEWPFLYVGLCNIDSLEFLALRLIIGIHNQVPDNLEVHSSGLSLT